ncbi:MAG: methyl-accepting chemotaxis sensory transducer [Pelosinus sp.]|nr:methyl-accepting chemotaxis sensory transducer [Pelosinus sp.]
MDEVTGIKKDKEINENNQNKKYHFVGFIKGLNSIRTKLIFAFLVPVFLIILLGILSYSKSSKGLIESYESSTLSTMSYMAKYLDFGTNTVSEKTEALKTNETMKKYYSGFYQNDKEEETRRFKEVQSSVLEEILSLKYISNIYILSNYGTGFSGNAMAASKLVYKEFADKGEGAFLEKSGEGERWIGAHPYLDELSGIKVSIYAISYMSYMYDIYKKPMGCVILDVSYQYVYETISESGFPSGSVVAFITSEGREIISGTVPEGYKFTKQSYYQDVLKKDLLEEGIKYIKFNNKDYLFAYSRLDGSGSMLCSVIPKSVIVGKANEVKNITSLVVVLASIIAITLGTYMAYGFSNTIKKVNGVLHKTEAGDLTCYTTIKRRDEFHILGNSINDVINSMQKLIRKMTGTSETVSKSAVIVSDSSGILVSATKNISGAVNDIEKGVTQQAVDAESCLHQMAALAEKINKLYSSTHNIEQIAGNTKQIVGSGIGIVDNLSCKAKDTTDVTRTVISDIENLEIESKAVSGIIKTINGIAEQTNLLSLNATIEAARAGEYGSGFSVVASEIRKLADQSLKASNEIAKIIQRIEGQTKKTVATARYAQSIVLSQEHALTSTVNVFTEINQHVENLTDNLNQIAVGVEGIENAKNDTLRAIESISATAQETAAATEELRVTAENQLHEVNKLNDVVQQLNDDAGSLEEAIRVFKI